MRLIDADVLKQDLTRFYDNEVTAKRLIDEQPTIEPCNPDTCKVVKAYMNEWDKPNNSDAISRQAVLDIVNNPLNIRLDEIIKKLPPVTPQPKTGRWIFVDKAHEHAHCSKCDYGNVDLMDGRPHNYCPNCGCRMVEPQESEEQKNCDTCTYSDEVDGSNCYECVKGMRNNYKAKVRDKGCR